VVGFDDVPLASLVAPALTTVRVDIAELGRSALEHLLDAIERPKSVAPITRQLLPQLVVRESCGGDRPSLRRSQRPVNPR